MENWRKIWRKGLAAQLSTSGLEALRTALVADDRRLLQGATTSPPPLQWVQDWPVEAACALGFCGWQGDGLETVAEVEGFCARIAVETDQALGEAAAWRCFLDWFDDTPRAAMRAQLLAEVNRSLDERRSQSSDQSNTRAVGNAAA